MYFCGKCKKVVDSLGTCTCGETITPKDEIIYCPNCNKMYYKLNPKVNGNYSFYCSNCKDKINVVFEDFAKKNDELNEDAGSGNKSKFENQENVNNVTDEQQSENVQGDINSSDENEETSELKSNSSNHYRFEMTEDIDLRTIDVEEDEFLEDLNESRGIFSDKNNAEKRGKSDFVEDDNADYRDLDKIESQARQKQERETEQNKDLADLQQNKNQTNQNNVRKTDIRKKTDEFDFSKIEEVTKEDFEKNKNGKSTSRKNNKKISKKEKKMKTSNENELDNKKKDPYKMPFKILLSFVIIACIVVIAYFVVLPAMKPDYKKCIEGYYQAENNYNLYKNIDKSTEIVEYIEKTDSVDGSVIVILKIIEQQNGLPIERNVKFTLEKGQNGLYVSKIEQIM